MKTTFLLVINCISLTSASLFWHVLPKAVTFSKSIFCTLQWWQTSKGINIKRADLAVKLLLDIQIALLYRNSKSKCSIFIHYGFLGQSMYLVCQHQTMQKCQRNSKMFVKQSIFQAIVQRHFHIQFVNQGL